MADKETLRVYDAKAADYAKLIDSDTKENPYLERFIARLPTGGRVLDLGCGPGLAATRMANAGLQVDAMDGSAEMVAMAAQHDGVTAWQATFDQITGTDIYDGIWANFCLLHASKEAMPHHLAAMVTALKPGGAFHIGMKLGSGSQRDAIGRLYSYYSEPELITLLGAAGLTAGETDHGRTVGLDGTEADWIVVAAHG
ncbi:MAG TPA: SAM-dependent methyltransferase [Rhodobacteraceae bacterium]|jgi:SAM-dependent methyltransferase|nr:class I SAM-dependent methyltransferase [Paracoccaceae bacterium]HBR61128.1 SAM-dependent methyltransferase [Paracoccaceae bacterium]|tara:strand:- start:425 stop:1018 length:594 start_codon:yes stop_codon:yes gene_type:complete